jgi:hypothetical protein
VRPCRTTAPLAIGIILGDILNQGIWAPVAFVTKGRF